MSDQSNLTVPELLAEAALKWPEKTALLFDPSMDSMTYLELEERTNAIASQLIELGVGPGDRVAVMSKNELEYPLSWLGIIKAKAIMVPINSFAMEADALHILNHSEAKAIILQEKYLEFITEISPKILNLKIKLVTTQTNSPGFYTLTKSQSALPPYSNYLSEDIANIQYTSGTTGKPKGCMLTNFYWSKISNAIINEPIQLTESDVLLNAQPFSYMDPQWTLLAGVRLGAKVVILDRFHPSSFWQKISEYNVTFFYCLGSMPMLMNEMPDSKFDKDHKLKFVACSAIPISLHKHLEERFKVPWFEVYGSTETGGDLVMSAMEQNELVGSGSIGRAFAHREVMIADDQDNAVARGEIGNILVRGLGMMLGYFKNPEESQRAFRSGWYHSGDTGWQDEFGRTFFVGRSKDIIRRSGENISAVEVESVLYLMDEIKLVACMPVVDSMRGEEIKALIVLRDGVAQLDIEKAVKFCSEKLAYFKVPRYWEICADLPLTESDKIAKGQLTSEKIAWKFDVFDSSINSWITK